MNKTFNSIFFFFASGSYNHLLFGLVCCKGAPSVADRALWKQVLTGVWWAGYLSGINTYEGQGGEAGLGRGSGHIVKQAWQSWSIKLTPHTWLLKILGWWAAVASVWHSSCDQLLDVIMVLVRQLLANTKGAGGCLLTVASSSSRGSQVGTTLCLPHHSPVDFCLLAWTHNPTNLVGGRRAWLILRSSWEQRWHYKGNVTQLRAKDLVRNCIFIVWQDPWRGPEPLEYSKRSWGPLWQDKEDISIFSHRVDKFLLGSLCPYVWLMGPSQVLPLGGALLLAIWGSVW